MITSRRTFLTLLRMNSGTVLPGVVSEPGDAAIDERLSTRGLQEEFKRGCDLGREIGAHRSSRP